MLDYKYVGWDFVEDFFNVNTAWLLDALKETLEQMLLRIDRVLIKNIFLQRHATMVLNERKIKVLNRLLDAAGEEFEQGINARKYQSLAKVSIATATRDLAELLEKDCLSKLPGGGRSTRYTVLLGRTVDGTL